jgi:3-dehydroquinate dehydratase-1
MLRLGDLALDGTPRIVAAATDRDLADTAWAALADVIELRADQCRDAGAAAVRATTDALARLGKPLIATVRWREEGGSGALTDPQRRALFEVLAPRAAALDIELASPLCDEVVALARQHRRLAIVSRHFFAATPPAAALEDVLGRGGERGDVVKIATAVHDRGDLARLVDLLRAPGPPRIVIGMGDEGAATRVFFPLLGSLLTYSFAGAPTAPGQLGLAPLYDALRAYSPAFAAAHPPRAAVESA